MQYRVQLQQINQNTNVIPISIMQSLKGLSKYFKKDKCTQIQRSCTSLSPKQNITRKNSNQVENQLLNFVNSNENRSVPNLFENVHKKNIYPIINQKTQKGRSSSIIMNNINQEDWKSKYLQLKDTLNQRITSLELELERIYAIEINAKSIIDQLNHQINQQNLQLEAYRNRVREIEIDLEKKNQQIKKLTIDINQFQIIINNEKNNQMDLWKQDLRTPKQPFLTTAMKQIQQIFEQLENSQTNYKIHTPLSQNLSISSSSMVEMINEMKESS
ncbi:unnamed protein product [Paramecium primaurelia]|uniref:Uncharacterized protein n=1 Tax=Paramecium primaurelia TaxID=5886 RepID=A0A8S1JXJ9_PARPR|nr:unnamed protein product [Paramecium primaurelia]